MMSDNFHIETESLNAQLLMSHSQHPSAGWKVSITKLSHVGIAMHSFL